jgi:hypothetical protein
LVPHEAVSRAGIDKLDVTGVAMVCISYLDISGSPAHLRYLLRRLRRRLPNAPLLVGLWPAEDKILTDKALRAHVGADHYVASLHDALKACLEAAHAAADAKSAAADDKPGGTEAPAASAGRHAARYVDVAST